MLNEKLCQLYLGNSIELVRGMDERLYLLHHRPGHCRVTVPQAINRPTGNKIKVLPAVLIPDPRPSPLDQGQRYPLHSMHKIPVLKLLPVTHSNTHLN